MARFETLDRSRSGDGLDSSEDPPWLLLRVGSPKQIRLHDASNWSLSTHSQGLVSAVVDGAASAADRRLTLTAHGAGTSTIEARSPDGRRAIHLTVYTRTLLRCTIAFYFVRDAGGHATRRASAEAVEVLRRLNEIYSPQAHLTFEQVDLQSVPVPGDLGDHIDIPRRGAGAEFRAIEDATLAHRVMGVRTLHRGMRARVRVHFVWSVRKNGSGGDDHEGAGRIGGDALVVEDELSADVATVVAHEVGHLLGLNHSEAERGWLMYPTTRWLGTTIPKRHVDILNPAS